MNNSAIIIDDDNSRYNKIKATLESSSIEVFIAENLYELMSKIYKYSIRILVFNPNLVWINVIEFINELKKLPNFNEFTIFFLYENMSKHLEKEAQRLNIICMKYPSHINKLVTKIENL
ncbi:transcriptional regulator [Brachyspira alvinipulli]|uniref:transcriptional regulator n=1 Tax=Brachyspira alvinipulli TaxID=84379 RepID=UPI000487AC88|nr:transcriptional regulator [Brachyspira alvinipulli]